MSTATRQPWQNAIMTLSAVVTTAIIFAFLYVGRVVLIPIAMAIFFTYVLSPVIKFLHRRGLGRTLAVSLTVSAAVLLFLGTSFLITRQLASLMETVAANRESLKVKVTTLRATILGANDSPLTLMLDDFEKLFNPTPNNPNQSVVLEPRQSAWTPGLTSIVGPATEAFAQAGFSFILVVFMLLSKTDIADRALRLLGDNRMTAATRAMSDASERLSRYLFRQFIVNITFGLGIAALLYVIGLNYSLLWGFLIAVMRYVPYIGTWIGVIPPALFAFATGEDWSLAIQTVVIIVGLELVVNNFLEPRIYGHSLGLSVVAQLISAALWSFLWGPVGLILSSPISTCLLVLGRHAPPFRFFEILLGTEPALTPAQSLFQRLAAKDQDEALRTLQQSLKDNDPESVFDAVLLPALIQLKTSRLAGQLTTEDDAGVTAIAREVLDETLEDIHEKPKGDEQFTQRVRLLACPAQDEFDRFSLDALTSQLPAAYWEIRVSSVTTLTSELLGDAAAFDPQVIVIGSLPPAGVAHARYLVKRLRQRFPQARLLVGRWHDSELHATEWTDAGADIALGSLKAAGQHLADWRPVFLTQEKAERGVAELV
ncbi:AI-2E family transporter [soil metagenome]